MHIDVRQLPAKECRRLATEECREVYQAWRRREIDDRELERRVTEICRRYGVRARGMTTNLILARPLTPTSIEIVHWYAARGCTPQETAEDINRPVEVIERVLRETKAPESAERDWWPRREAAIRGRLPSYMNVIRQQRGLTA